MKSPEGSSSVWTETRRPGCRSSRASSQARTRPRPGAASCQKRDAAPALVQFASGTIPSGARSGARAGIPVPSGSGTPTGGRRIESNETAPLAATWTRETGFVPMRKTGSSKSSQTPPDDEPCLRQSSTSTADADSARSATLFVRTSTGAKDGSTATVAGGERSPRGGSFVPPGFVPPMATAQTRPATSAPFVARFIFRTSANRHFIAGDFAIERPRATAPAVPHIAISATPNISGEPRLIAGSEPPDRCRSAPKAAQTECATPPHAQRRRGERAGGRASCPRLYRNPVFRTTSDSRGLPPANDDARIRALEFPVDLERNVGPAAVVLSHTDLFRQIATPQPDDFKLVGIVLV